MNDRCTRGPTALMIDDANPFAASLRERLTVAGYSVRRIASGQEAQVWSAAANADVILLSAMLPGTDGLILCASLKARTSAHIILFGDRVRDVDRALALELGAVDVLTRPGDIDALLARLPSAFEQTRPTAGAVATGSG